MSSASANLSGELQSVSESKSAEQPCLSWLKGPWIYAQGEAALFKAMKEHIPPSLLSCMPGGWDTHHNLEDQQDTKGYAIHLARPLTGFRWTLSEYYEDQDHHEQVVDLRPEFVSTYANRSSVWTCNGLALCGVMRLQRPMFVDPKETDHDPEERPMAEKRLGALMGLLVENTLQVHSETAKKLGLSLSGDLPLPPDGAKHKEEDLMKLLSAAQYQQGTTVCKQGKESLQSHEASTCLADMSHTDTAQELEQESTLLPDIQELYKVSTGQDLTHFDQESCTCAGCQLFEAAQRDGEEGAEAQASMIGRGHIPKFSTLNIELTYPVEDCGPEESSAGEAGKSISLPCCPGLDPSMFG